MMKRNLIALTLSSRWFRRSPLSARRASQVNGKARSKCSGRTAPKEIKTRGVQSHAQGQGAHRHCRSADQQWKVDKGAVNAGKATFEVQQPDGPLFKFTLTLVDGRLQGDMAGERDGVLRMHARVDAARAKPPM